ncbi:MAG: PilZ domain-containing protein [Deltaproteobacteria bacterium]|nr:PilZ domain-containing protein [Deltaproteobacteria bacterium]
MRKRPFLLFLCSLLFLYFPVEWTIRLSSGQPFRWVEALFFVLLPLFLIFGLIKVTKVGWYTLVSMIALWGIQDLNLYYSTRGQAWSLLSHLGIYLLSLSYFINPRVRHLYFDPKMRWWRTKPRFETFLPLVIQRENHWDYPTMRNISEGGCFLETSQLGGVAEKVFVYILLPIPLSVSVIKVEGEVRWVSNSQSKRGMGIQFHGLSQSEQSVIREFVHRGF